MSEFILIEKQKLGTETFPKNTLRVRKTGVSLSKNVTDRLSKVAGDAKRGSTIKLSIEVDMEENKIRVTPSDSGFSFFIQPTGLASMANFPTAMKKMGVPLGDYVSRNNGNTFVLVG